MADPLTAAASEFAPRPSDLFDPRESGDIYNRWANAAAGFNTAREVNQGVAEAEDQGFRRERARQDKIIFDREDAEYKDKLDFEEAKGELLLNLADAMREGDYEEKVNTMLATTPQLADDEAFKSMVNVGKLRYDRIREDKERERLERIREDEQEADLLAILGAAGADEKFVQGLRNPETGRINLKQAALAAGQKKYEAARADAAAEATADARDAVVRTFADDSSLQDRVKAGDAVGIEALVKQREAALKGINASFTPEDLKLSEDAFAAKLSKDLIPDTLALENEEKAKARSREISAIAKDYHRAIRARSLVGPAAPAAKAEGNPAARTWFNTRVTPSLPKPK